jgi:hypothetical protein
MERMRAGASVDVFVAFPALTTEAIVDIGNSFSSVGALEASCGASGPSKAFGQDRARQDVALEAAMDGFTAVLPKGFRRTARAARII